jgi:hypothetical protein
MIPQQQLPPPPGTSSPPAPPPPTNPPPPSSTADLCQDMIFWNTPQKPLVCIDSPNVGPPSFVAIPNSLGQVPSSNISRFTQFSVHNITGRYNQANTTFTLFVVGTKGQSLGIQLKYNFDGNAIDDRFETWSLPLENVVQDQGDGRSLFKLTSQGSSPRSIVGNYSNFNGGSIRILMWSSNAVAGEMSLQTDGTRDTIGNSSVLNIPWTGFSGTAVFGKVAGEPCLVNSECETNSLCVGSVGLQGSVNYCAPPCQSIDDCKAMFNSFAYIINLPEEFRTCNRWNTYILSRLVGCVPEGKWPSFAGPDPGRFQCAYICPELMVGSFTDQNQLYGCGCLPGYHGMSTATLNFTCIANVGLDCSLIQPCFAAPNPPTPNCDITACNIADCEKLVGTCTGVAVQGCNPSTPVSCTDCNIDCLIEFYPFTDPRTIGNNFQFPNPLAAGSTCCNNCPA